MLRECKVTKMVSQSLEQEVVYAATLHPQHAPSVRAAYAHSLPKLHIRHRWKALHQDLGHLLPSRGVSQFNRLVLDNLSQEVITHIYMLDAIVEFRVSCDGDG